MGLRVTRMRFVGLRVTRKRFVGLQAARSGLRVARKSDSEVLRAARKLQKPASAGLRVAGLRSCWLGAPLKPFGGSLQAFLSTRDCLGSGPHIAESTGLRNVEF